MRRLIFLGYFLLTFGFISSNLALAEQGKEPETLPAEIFEIDSSGGNFRFLLEIANTPETRRKGLMFRKSLASFKGMILDYGKDVRAGVWMKNVLIPLDILFVKSDGRIESIISRAVPNSKETMKSTSHVRAVIEINGGTTEKLAIRPGDMVIHRMFGNDK